MGAAASRKTAFLALGSNRGDRAALIERALTELAAAGVTLRRRSSFYETQPVGMTARRWFLNAVVEIETDRLPLRLFRLAQRIQHSLGRRPSGPPERGRAGPQPAARTIDIDILYYGHSIIRSPELVIPHPRLDERRFVLVPLAEIAPGFRHPLTGRTSNEMLAALSDTSIVRPWRG